MSVFPQCSFSLSIDGGALVPGTRATGTITVEAPEPMLRAKELGFVFSSLVSAQFGAGSSRRVITETLFTAPMSFPIKGGVLAEGVHHFPFALDVPEGLPPGFKGPGCEVVHRLRASIDVDWAFDPAERFVVAVTVPPTTGTRRPLTTRSPDGFHDAIALDVTLASSIVALGEPISGRIALRAGHEARFDEVEVTLLSVATLDLDGHGGRRVEPVSTTIIPAEALRAGHAAPIHFPPVRDMLPTFGSAHLQHDLALLVTVKIPWARDPSFEVPLQILPRGSALDGDAGAAPLGSERLQRVAAAMASATGLREASAPTLVEGVVGPVTVRITDAPRGSDLGVELAFAFPELELGIALRPLGLLDGFRRSPLLPRALRDGYLLALEPRSGRPELDDAALRPLFDAALGDLPDASDLVFSDRRLELRAPLPDDEPERLVGVARRARSIAESIAKALATMPFPPAIASAEAAWRQAAEEQGATLVPTGPALYGVMLRARVLGGEERAIVASIRTAWKSGTPSSWVDLDLRGAPAPATPRTGGDDDAAWLETTRAVFPTARVLDAGRRATLESPEWAADPRALLPAIEAFFAFVLHARGERRAESAYR